MRALSLWRPWPWAFIHGDKRIENRPWEIKFRGDVVFQAAQRFDFGAVGTIQRVGQLAHPGDWNKRPICSGNKSMHPAGVLSFVGEIVDCVTRDNADGLARRGITHFYGDVSFGKQLDPQNGFDWNAQMPWIFGPWCTVVVNIRPILKTIPWKGSQKWFDVPDAIVAEALAA